MTTTQQQIDTLLDELTPNQLKFIQARLFSKTDKEAAEKIGLIGRTVSEWKREGAPIDEIIRLYNKDATEIAIERFRESADEAAMMIIRLMRTSNSEMMQFSTAKEVLDRSIGKPVQRNENANQNEFIVRHVNDWRDPTADAAPGTEGGLVAAEALQLASGGTQVEEDDTGSTDSSGQGPEGEDGVVGSTDV